MQLSVTAGETDVEVATFGCSFFALELTLMSAPANSILGLLSPLPCSSSLLPLFRPTVLVAVLHVGSVAMAFDMFSA